MPTIRDVAKACGVSPMTVSFVLNNAPGQVGAKTRERVLQAVREMGYRPAVLGHSRNQQVNTLGVLSSLSGETFSQFSYYNSILNGILAEADRRHQNVTLFSHHLWSNTTRNLRIYCDGRCDGLLVVAPPLGSKLIRALHERGIPCVLIGDSSEASEFSGVDVDNIPAAEAMTAYLFAQGHHRVGLLGGSDKMRSAVDRETGFRQAHENQGISVDEGLVSSGEYGEQSGYERARVLMSGPMTRRPTALFCGNDEIALGALRAVQELQLRVPQDVSILGFDDDPRAAASDPPLTTMRQPFEQIGKRAVERLLDAINDPGAPPQQALLPTEFILRSSVASPPVDNLAPFAL